MAEQKEMKKVEEVKEGTQQQTKYLINLIM